MNITDQQTKQEMGLCMFPTCQEYGDESHHIIFRSESRKTCIDEDWNIIQLCPFHHRIGQTSPHRMRVWREHYKRYLPNDWTERE